MTSGERLPTVNKETLEYAMGWLRFIHGILELHPSETSIPLVFCHTMVFRSYIDRADRGELLVKVMRCR